MSFLKIGMDSGYRHFKVDLGMEKVAIAHALFPSFGVLVDARRENAVDEGASVKLNVGLKSELAPFKGDVPKFFRLAEYDCLVSEIFHRLLNLASASCNAPYCTNCDSELNPIAGC